MRAAPLLLLICLGCQAPPSSHRVAGSPAVVVRVARGEHEARIVIAMRQRRRASVTRQTVLGSVRLDVELDVAVDARGQRLTPRVVAVEPALRVTSIGLEVEVGVRDSVFLPTFSGGEFVEAAQSVHAVIDTGVAASMQVTAQYGNDGRGCVLFAEDPSGTKPKRFRCDPSGGRCRLAIEYYVTDGHAGRAEAPVPTRLLRYGFDPALEPGWYPAAKLYRAWLEAHATGPGGILSRGPLALRRDLPRWLEHLDLFVTEQFGWFPEHARVANPLFALRRLGKVLGADSMLVGLWFSADKKAPLGRAGSWLAHPATARQVEALRDDGIRFTAYSNPGDFDKANPLFAAAGMNAFGVKDAAGRAEQNMDVAAPELAEWFGQLGYVQAKAGGFSGMYFDYPATVGVSEASWLGFRSILARSRKGAKLAGRDFATFHEAAFEWLIPEATLGQGAVGVVGRAYADEPRTRGVPFFQTVYSGYTQFWPAEEGSGPQTLMFDPGFYGDPESLSMTRMLAEGFTWGGILNTSEPLLFEGKLACELDAPGPLEVVFEHHYKTLTNLIALRRRARQWLVHGEMLNSPAAGGDRADVTVMRLFAGPRLQHYDKLAVPVTAWRARDGSVLLVAANGGLEAAHVDIDLARSGWSARWLRDLVTGELIDVGADRRRVTVTVAGGDGRLLALDEARALR